MASTKTFIPLRRPDLLHRPRLVEHVRRHTDKALTLVSAPAGYGKTSLLVDACYDAPFPVCWLSLDESDRDLGAFADHLVAAVQRRFPDFSGSARRALRADPNAGRDPAMLGNIVAQDMADNISQFFVLVLDDYHVLDRSPWVRDFLGVILEHADRRGHFIVSTRTIPGNLPSINLVAQGLMAFVGRDDLAFTGDEVRQALAQTHGLDLTPEQAGELVAAGEGWITGILLATASMWRGIHDALVRARTQDGLVYTYLADQAFDGQPEALQDTMLTMSTLSEMNETTCHRALGLNGAGRVLEELERRGLFLTIVVDESETRHYRYHHLFRDFLQARLQAQDPGRFRRLHRQAAEQFEADGQWERAVAHRLDAGDHHATARAMDAAAKTMYVTGRLETLVSWYETVPELLRSECPRLLLFASRAFFELGRADESIPLLRRAEATFRERGEVDQVLAAVQQRATILCAQGRYTEMLDMAQASLAVRDVPRSNSPVLTAEAHRLIGVAHLNLGRLEKAVEHLRLALDLHRELETREVAVTYLELALALLRLGRLDEGWTCQDKAVELFRLMPPSDGFAATLNDIAYERHYLTGEYGQALALFREALGVARQAGAPRTQTAALLSIADLYRDLGALQEAQKLYAQAKGFARQSSYADLVNFALLGEAQALAQTGDVFKALGPAAEARDRAQERGNIYQLGLSCLTLGAIHLQTGDPQAALTEIGRGRDQLKKSGARRDLTRAYVLLARAHRAAGDVETSLDMLRQALRVGAETQTVHYLLVEGQHVFDLFKQLLKQNPADRRPAQIMDRIRALPDVARRLVGGPTLTVLPHDPVLRFYGFGPGHVEKDGQPVVWNSALARHLTFYLLMHPPRSRDQIFAAFWPGVKLETARSAFHNTKSRAHKALGRQFVNYKDGLYRLVWDPDCWFDVTVFESLLDGHDGNRQTRLEQAVALYRGDFMETYDAEWCLSIRERLRTRYRDALLELGELYMEKGKLADALPTLRCAVAQDDLYEPAVRALMRLHILNGQSRLALDIFHCLERRLEGLHVFPGEETQALCRSIRLPPS
jgi:ATP/maltotriose-dependent transcriptional regulator MalT/DNA-binding SARP family transcriptional activator